MNPALFSTMFHASVLPSGARFGGRIGKLVKILHVPNAVKVMVFAYATGAIREGARIRRT